jgi:hypothetical protein
LSPQPGRHRYALVCRSKNKRSLHGCVARLANPTQLIWHDDEAWLDSTGRCEPMNAIVRFYQGEWLARLPPRLGWQNFFRGGKTPVANPGVAVISESKRFPLVWNELSTPMRAWRSLLPETRDPRDAPWQADDDWLLKSAMCNTGDSASVRALMVSRRWQTVAREVRWFPNRWVAQRRFHTRSIPTPLGPMFPCIGVYTLNGRACGAYGRLARSPVVNFSATDVAVLVENEAGL